MSLSARGAVGRGRTSVTSVPLMRLDGAAVGLREQVVDVLRDEVDDAELDGLVGGGGDAVADGVLGPVGVAAALLAMARAYGGGVVLDLVAERRPRCRRRWR